MSGLFDTLKGLLGGDANASKVLESIKTTIDERGLDDMLERFKSSGFGDKVQSWIGTGENAELRPDEVKSALGSELDGIAERAGLDRDQAADAVAKALPKVVDELTPEGTLPSADAVKGKLGSLVP